MPDSYESKNPEAGYNLNPAQKEAIHFNEGTMLVLAGPGSGKTQVITQRIRYLIEECRIPPGQILVITFTKAAAFEMKNRCYNICENSVHAVFGTFHSIFYQILKNSNQYQNYSIITTYEKREIMKEILSVHGYESIQLIQMADQMLMKISQFKNMRHDTEENDARQELNYKNKQKQQEQTNLLDQEEVFHRIREAYERECKRRKVMDYDDILIFCHELLLSNAEERQKWQSRFHYILIDEFQDVNQIQYQIVCILANGYKNLFVVGDDDQSIYAFRGSDPFYMKKFLKDFPQSKKVCLSINYRCGDKIVSAASKCISHNQSRFQKELKSIKNLDNEFILKNFKERDQELEFICNKIKYINENEKIAILLRTNKKTEYLAEWLYKRKIPCIVNEKRKCFYEQQYIMDILSILKFCFVSPSRHEFLTFMNKPTRYISRESLTDLIVNFDLLKDNYKANKSVLRNIEMLEKDCNFLKCLDPYACITFIMNGMGYLKYLKERMRVNATKFEDILHDIEEFKQKSKGFKTVPLFLDFIEEFCKDFHNQSEDGEWKKVKDKKKNTGFEKDMDSVMGKKMVYLMTYHSSKGLEFDHVFLPGINRGEVPHGRALSKEELEEERRMFYVAMTRAQKSLTITYISDLNDDMNEQSVFIRELSGN